MSIRNSGDGPRERACPMEHRGPSGFELRYAGPGLTRAFARRTPRALAMPGSCCQSASRTSVLRQHRRGAREDTSGAKARAAAPRTLVLKARIPCDFPESRPIANSGEHDRFRLMSG